MKPARGPQTMFWGNDCCGIILVPTMKGQAKCAKAIFVSLFRQRDSRSARNVCHYEPLPAPIWICRTMIPQQSLPKNIVWGPRSGFIYIYMQREIERHLSSTWRNMHGIVNRLRHQWLRNMLRCRLPQRLCKKLRLATPGQGNHVPCLRAISRKETQPEPFRMSIPYWFKATHNPCRD